MNLLYKSCLGPLFYAQRASQRSLFISICKIFARIMFYRVTINGVNEANLLFINNSMQRQDLLQDYEVLRSYFLKKGIKSNNATFQYKLNPLGINFNNIIKLTYHKNLRAANYQSLLKYRSTRIGALARLYLFLRISEAAIIFDHFSEYISRSTIRQVIVHKEMEFLQNIFVLASKQNKVQTIALQHGFYEDSGEMVNVQNVNSINYLASVSDLIWCWGETSKLLFQRYTRTPICVIGIPSDLQSIKEQFSEKCAVILDSVDRVDTNCSLEAIAKQHNSVIFYHPDDPRYTERVKDLLSTNAKFYLGCHSSFLLKAKLAGREVLLLPGSRLLEAGHLDIDGDTGLVKFTDNLMQCHVRQSGLQSCELAFQSLKFAGATSR